MVSHDSYYSAPEHAYSGGVNDLSDGTTDVRCALLDATHTKDLDTHTQWTDVEGDEVTGDGYTAGGVALDNNTLTRSGNTTTFDADDAVWADSTISAGYAVVYDAGSGNLLTNVDFEGEESSDSGEFRIEWHANGIFYVNA